MQQACEDATQVAQEGCLGRQQLDVQQLSPADVLRMHTPVNPGRHSSACMLQNLGFLHHLVAPFQGPGRP